MTKEECQRSVGRDVFFLELDCSPDESTKFACAIVMIKQVYQSPNLKYSINCIFPNDIEHQASPEELHEITPLFDLISF